MMKIVNSACTVKATTCHSHVYSPCAGEEAYRGFGSHLDR